MTCTCIQFADVTVEASEELYSDEAGKPSGD